MFLSGVVVVVFGFGIGVAGLLFSVSLRSLHTTYTTVENRYSSTKNIYVLHNIYNDIQTAGLCGDAAATAAITLQPEKEHELNYYGSKMYIHIWPTGIIGIPLSRCWKTYIHMYINNRLPAFSTLFAFSFSSDARGRSPHVWYDCALSLLDFVHAVFAHN